MVIMHEWKEKGRLKEKRMRRWTEEGKGVKEGSETRGRTEIEERAMRRQKHREEEEDEGNREIDQTES